MPKIGGAPETSSPQVLRQVFKNKTSPCHVEMLPSPASTVGHIGSQHVPLEVGAVSPPLGWGRAGGQETNPGTGSGPPASSPGPCHRPLSWRPSSVLHREEPGHGPGGSEHVVSCNITGKEWKSCGSHLIRETVQVLHPVILQISGVPVSAALCV